MKKFLLFMTVLFSTAISLLAQDPVYFADFSKKNGTGSGGYQTTSKLTFSDSQVNTNSWTTTGFNDSSHSWPYIKCGGSKSGNQNATIQTSFQSSKIIGKIDIAFAGGLSQATTNINIEFADNNQFSNSKTITDASLQGIVTTAALSKTVNVTIPSGSYIRFNFTCTNTSSTNGGIWVESIKLYPGEKADAGLSFKDGETAVTTWTVSKNSSNPTFPTFSSATDATISYNSSNESVATVDSEGKITLVGRGTTTISASALENDSYKQGSASYTLNITDKPSLYFDYNVLKASLGQVAPTNTLNTDPTGLKLSYSSSNTGVATVDATTGALTLVADGSTTITVKSEADADKLCEAADASYTLNVSSKEFPGLAFDQASYTAVAGKSFTAPTLTNPKNVTVTYESTVPTVASVDATTGAVTPLAFGETVIKATSEETETLATGHAEYTLSVSRQTTSLNFSASTATADMANYAVNSYPNLTIEPSSASGKVEYTSSNPNVADFVNGELTLKDKGTTTITASIPQDGIYTASSASYELTVVNTERVVFDYTTKDPGNTVDDVTVTYIQGSGTSTPGFYTNEYRFYTKNTLTITAPQNYYIRSIEFGVKSGYKATDIKYDNTALTSSTWTPTGVETSATFTASAQVRFSSITVTLGKIVKQNSSVEFGATEYPVKYGETVTVAATANPADLAVTYSCDESKATVNATTGLVTPKTVGDVTITATVAGNAFFNGSSATTTVKVSKGDATLAFNPAAGTIAKGKTIATTLSNPKGLSISYTSSDETVATVATNGVITAIKAGSATITATGTSALYNDASATYSLTVTDKTPAGISFTAPEFTAIAGKTVTGEPTLTNPHKLSVTYSSDSEAVATVSTEGKITAVGAGTATITASFTENEEYEGASVSYTITVVRQTPTFTFNPAELSVRLDDTGYTLPTLSKPEGITATYSFDPATSVATIDATTGELTLNAIGTATVKASMAQTSVYEAADATYTLKVLPKLPTFEYSARTATWLLNETNNAALPTLNKTAGLSDFSFTSSNEKVATVDANGIVSIVGRGKTTITASVQAQGDYDAATASYELTVMDPTIAEYDPASYGYTESPYSLSGVTQTCGNVTFQWFKNLGTTNPAFVKGDNTTRLYPKNSATIKAASDFYIKSISFTTGSSVTSLTVVADNLETGDRGILNGKIWTASEGTAPESVTVTYTGTSSNIAFSSITVNLGKKSEATGIKVPVTFTPNAITAYLGEDATLPASSIPTDASVTYVSNAEAVVTVDPSTGALTPVAEGTATITATINKTSKYLENSGSYTVTVKKQPHGLAYEPASGTADMEKLGEFTSPVLKNEKGRTPISFSTSDATVATVDNNGVVTPVHKGKATITASFAGSDIVEAGSASFELEVLDARIPVFDFSGTSDPGKTLTVNNTQITFDSSCSWQNYAGGKSILKYVANATLSIKAPAGNYVKAVKLSFKDPVVREQLTPSIPTPASAKRRAASNRAGEYNVEKHTWTATAGTTPSEIVLTNTGTQINVNSLEVETAPVADAGKALPTVTVSAETATATLTEAFTAPSFEVDPASLSLSYESSVPTVATVNPTTGEVTLVGAGKTTIKAKTTEDADYLEAWASYELTVNRHSADLSFAQARYDGTIGSAFEAPALTNPYSLTVKAASSDPSVADFVEGVLTLKSKGKTTITYSSEQTDTYLAGTASYILVVEDPSSPLAIFDYTLGKEPVATDANVTVEYQSGTGYDADNKALQIGKSNNCLFNAAEGYYITKLTVEGTQVENNANISVIAKDKELSNNKGTYDVATRTWTAATRTAPTIVSLSNQSSVVRIDRVLVETAKLGDIVKIDPEFSFNKTEVEVEVGRTYIAPTFINPDGVSPDVYSSSNEKVVYISPKEALITVGKPGTAVITVTTKPTAFYNSVSASYTVNVTAVAANVGEILALAKDGYNGKVRMTGELNVNHVLDNNMWVSDATGATMLTGQDWGNDYLYMQDAIVPANWSGYIEMVNGTQLKIKDITNIKEWTEDSNVELPLITPFSPELTAADINKVYRINNVVLTDFIQEGETTADDNIMPNDVFKANVDGRDLKMALPYATAGIKADEYHITAAVAADANGEPVLDIIETTVPADNNVTVSLERGRRNNPSTVINYQPVTNFADGLEVTLGDYIKMTLMADQPIMYRCVDQFYGENKIVRDPYTNELGYHMYSFAEIPAVDGMAAKEFPVLALGNVYYRTLDAKGIPTKTAKVNFYNPQGQNPTGVEGLIAPDTEEHWFTLDGLAIDKPGTGMYIRVKGNKVEKVVRK